jgi:glycine betaine/proline transport system permease protein
VTVPPAVSTPPVTAPSGAGSDRERFRLPRWAPWAIGTALAIALYVVFKGRAVLPHSEDAAAFHIVNEVRDWIDANRNSSPIFLFFVNYIRLFIDVYVTALQAVLHPMGWPGLIAAAGALGWALAGWRIALVSVLGLAGCGVLGVWDYTVDTVAMMIAAVSLSLLIGLPLGVWAGRSPRVRRLITPVLDVMQIMPTFAYLTPMTLFFLIGPPPATICTMIYSVPAAIRITALGIRMVPGPAVEASASLGASAWQTMRKVRLPMARTTILLAVNQTIMLAMSMVVITGLIDAPGLPEQIMEALSRVNTGMLFDGGIAIVFLAVVLDRLTRSRPATGRGPRVPGRVRWAIAAVVAVAGVAAAQALPPEFPEQLVHPLAGPVNTVTDWIELHWFTVTDAIKNGVSYGVLNPLQTLLTTAPWWLIVALVLLVSLRFGGLRPALTAAGCLIGIALLGLWRHSMETLTMVLVALVLTILAGAVLGIASARSDRFSALLRPLLDTAQTIPAFVYLLPAVALFSSSRFTAILATVIYAVPPVVRLIEDGIRAVPATVVEAAASAGSTSRQLLWKVQMPMSRRSTVLALNQGIIMILAMVVLGGLVGAGALGYDVVAGFSQHEDFGKGFCAGIAIVLLGVMLDRVTQGSAAAREEASTR